MVALGISVWPTSGKQGQLQGDVSTALLQLVTWIYMSVGAFVGITTGIVAHVVAPIVQHVYDHLAAIWKLVVSDTIWPAIAKPLPLPQAEPVPLTEAKLATHNNGAHAEQPPVEQQDARMQQEESGQDVPTKQAPQSAQEEEDQASDANLVTADSGALAACVSPRSVYEDVISPDTPTGSKAKLDLDGELSLALPTVEQAEHQPSTPPQAAELSSPAVEADEPVVSKNSDTSSGTIWATGL